METQEAAELALHEKEDCLEALNGRVAAGILGYVFLEMVESVIEERERVIEDRDFGRGERHFSITWRKWEMTYGMLLRKREL